MLMPFNLVVSTFQAVEVLNNQRTKAIIPDISLVELLIWLLRRDAKAHKVCILDRCSYRSFPYDFRRAPKVWLGSSSDGKMYFSFLCHLKFNTISATLHTLYTRRRASIPELCVGLN